MAAAGEKVTTSLSLFMEAFALEAEEDLSTLATHCWAEGVWMEKWPVEMKEAWRKQIFEVQDVEATERTCRSGDHLGGRIGIP